MKTLAVLAAWVISSALALHSAETADVSKAVAVLHHTAGQQCHGVVRFTQDGESVKVVADLEGLTPGQKHALHIHQYGDCSAPDGMSAGGHYNPEGHQHGLPDGENRHAGDLGNVQADEQGKAHYEITVTNISIMGAEKSDHRSRGSLFTPKWMMEANRSATTVAELRAESSGWPIRSSPGIVSSANGSGKQSVGRQLSVGLWRFGQ